MIAAVLLLLASVARAQPADLDARLGELRHGDWNARIHAAHALGEMGTAGLPGLRLAAQDADWQVRMTAAHLMGRLGAPAVPDLAVVLREEPCRHVRLTALHWLGAIGTPEAEEALRSGLSDESGMVRLMGRYWLDKGGPPDAARDDDAGAAEKEDLKYCESSSGPGRASWLEARRAAAAGPQDGPEIHETVVTPDPPARGVHAAAATPGTFPPGAAGLPPRPGAAVEARAEPVDRARLKELDALLDPNDQKPEALPGAAALARRAEPSLEADSTAAPSGRPSPDGSVRAVAARGPAESLPAAPAGLPERSPSEASGAALMPDAGTGKLAADPLPELLRLLADADPRKRARAADELGRRGAAAASSEPALAAALADRDRRVRASAALALGNLGSAADAAVPALVRALKRGPEEVEWSAAVALGRIGTPRARRAFARYARQSAGDFLKKRQSGD